MQALRALLRSSIRTRRLANLASTAIVAITVTVTLMLAAGAARTVTASDRYQDAQGGTFDALVEQVSGPPRTEDIAQLDVVDAVHSMTFLFAGLEVDGADAAYDAIAFAGSTDATGMRLVDGREPDPAEPGEFVASERFVEAFGLDLGDTALLRSLTAQQVAESGFENVDPAGPEVTATLVGVITGPTELQDGQPLLMFPPTLLEVGDIGVAATIHAVGLRSGATLDDLRSGLDQVEGGFGIENDALLVPDVVRDAAATRGAGIAVLALIVAIAVVVVIGQLLGRQFRGGEAESGQLRAVGMTPPQVTALPALRSLLPVLAGVTLAGVAAWALSGTFPLGFVESIEPAPGIRLEPLVHLAGPLLIGITILGWVYFASALTRFARATPPTNSIVRAVATKVQSAQAATGIRFAFTRGQRQASSPVAPLIGIALVMATLLAALTFGVSLGRLVDEPARWGQDFLAIGQGSEEVPADDLQLLAADPDVSALARSGLVIVSVGSESLDVVGRDPLKGSPGATVLEGRLAQGIDEMAVGRTTARRLGVGVGDRLEVEAPSGRRGLTVTGIIVVPVGAEGGDGIGDGGLVTGDALLALDPDQTFGNAVIELRPGAPPDTRERLEEAIEFGVGQPDPPGTILNLDRIRAIPYVVVATLAGLALLSLAHQLIVSAQRRRHDVAVLRALGAGGRWVGGVVHWQATVFTAGVLAAALPVGFLAGQAVFRWFVDRIGAVNTATLPLWMLAVTVVALLVLANLVAVVPAVRARTANAARLLAGE